jgi:hypothetical protein
LALFRRIASVPVGGLALFGAVAPRLSSHPAPPGIGFVSHDRPPARLVRSPKLGLFDTISSSHGPACPSGGGKLGLFVRRACRDWAELGLFVQPARAGSRRQVAAGVPPNRVCLYKTLDIVPQTPRGAQVWLCFACLAEGNERTRNEHIAQPPSAGGRGSPPGAGRVPKRSLFAFGVPVLHAFRALFCLPNRKS